MGGFCSRSTNNARVHPPNNNGISNGNNNFQNGCSPHSQPVSNIGNPFYNDQNYNNPSITTNSGRSQSVGAAANTAGPGATNYGTTGPTTPGQWHSPLPPSHAGGVLGSFLPPPIASTSVAAHTSSTPSSSHTNPSFDLFPENPSLNGIDTNSLNPFLFTNGAASSSVRRSNSSRQNSNENHNENYSRNSSNSNVSESNTNQMVQDLDLALCPFCGAVKSLADIHLHVSTEHTVKANCQVNRYRLDQSQGQECIICLEEMLAGELVALLPCTCVFHNECLEKWFAKQGWCPNHPALGIQSFDLVTSYSV